MEHLLKGLNEGQRAAVLATEGPVLVLAGAGSGKTRVITLRTGHLLERRVAPENILAMTFTKKAAGEMRERIGALVGKDRAELLTIGTFHSFCVKLLRHYHEAAGLPPNFTICDASDQLSAARGALRELRIGDATLQPAALQARISLLKNKLATPESVLAGAGDDRDELIGRAWAKYQEHLDRARLVDFDDLLLMACRLLKKDERVRQELERIFRYVMVDEYQDTNGPQYEIVRAIAGRHQNLCVVGDDDQSIYGWRGAEVGNILRFEKDFPGAQVIRLEQNYRSTGHILATASGIIAKNAGRLGKTLWTAGEPGEKVRLIGHWDGEEEARWIGEEVEAIQRGTRGRDPLDLNQQAILVRASHQMRAFEDRFLTIGLPYRVIGGPRFYERQEIRDAMAYFRLAVSPEDDLAFERVVNLPKRGLGDTAQAKINVLARAAGVSLLDGAREALAKGVIPGKGAAQLGAFVDGVDRWHLATLHPEYDHIRLAETILDESGYTEMWQADKTPEAPGRLDNLKELVKALEQFDNLQGFLEHVSLIMDNETEGTEEKVTIMTLHAAKGLEFPVVFLPGWEDGLFPSQRSMDESGLKGLEEERRLAYVGITRAEEICTISFASNRRVYGQWQSQLPSRFIDELSADHVEVLTAPGLYGGGYGAAAQVGFGSGLEERVSRADVYNSPGWRRMQENSGARPMRQPQEARHVVIDMEAASPYVIGDRVFHQKFGYGEIMGIEGDKLDVEFDHAGTKKVVARWVIPADQVDDVPF